jgi:prevent-host-death family protein
MQRHCDNSEEKMTRKFSELRAKMTPEARVESAETGAALRTQLPLHQHRQPLRVSAQISEISGTGGQRYGNPFRAGSNSDACIAMGDVATYLQSNMDAPMTITTISSREFNQDTSRAKKAALDGPVFITDRGRPAHVLITIEEYQRLTGAPMTLAEALAQPDVSDFEFDPPKIKGRLSKPVDLS